VSELAPSAVTTTSATLKADVNPQGKAVLYRIEVGPDDCAANSCSSVKDGEIPLGSLPVRIVADLSGLTPGTTYHYRVVASGGGGETQGLDRTFMTYLPPQPFAPCPNDDLRLQNPASARIEHSSANLPDCRAYERATPRDKNAGDVTGTVPFARAALSGDAIGFISTSGVPGGVGSQEFPSYLARRHAASWSTEGTLPPGGDGQTAQVLGWTPDFSAVFSKSTRFGEPFETEVLMTPAGGGQIQVVDYTTAELRPRLAGASGGAARVLFESKVALPGVTGAIAGKPNLYLWDKASGELFLAGIENNEQAPPAGAFAGSYDWITGATPKTLSEGGAARDYYTQEQHVISADGEAVYFTAAGSGQFYLRLNPTAEQSAVDGSGKCTEDGLACTIRVSASRKANGQGPGGGDSGGPRPAAFMGASPDGSAALFTSSEKLTDDANTGPEQEPAQIERADIGGGNLAPGFLAAHASDIEVDATHIYWINTETEAIQRAKLDGSGVVEDFIGAEATDNPRGIGIAGEYIYWANAAKEDGGGAIGRAKIGAGGAEEVNEDFVEGAGNPHDVAVQGEFLYWTNSAVQTSNEAYIGRAKAIDGGELNTKFVTVFGGETKKLWGIAIDGEHIYWVVRNNQGEGRIHRVDIDGDPESYLTEFIFLGAGAEGKDVGVQGGRIYWTAQANSLVGRAKLNGAGLPSEVEREWIKEADHPQGMAVDGAHVYWAANGESVANPGNDLYRYAQGALEDISVDSTDFAGSDVQGVLGASEGGDYVYYAANGVPDKLANSPNARGESAAAGDCNRRVGFGASGTCNLYVWHAGTSSFIARLDIAGEEFESDAANWATKTSGIFFNDFSFEKTARVTDDGRTLVFRSQRRLTGYENEGIAELYRYRAGEAGPICVSCNPTQMAPSSQGAGFGRVFPAVVAPSGPASTLSRNLSADGNRVFFESTDALVGADTNGEAGCPPTGSGLQSYPACLDVYEWEALGTGSCDGVHAIAEGGCVYLLSTGRDTGPALIADAGEDGNNVFFYSRAHLVGEDEDQLMDVYDARVDGGLATQNEPLQSHCEGEGCKPAASSFPAIPVPPSIPAPGNPKNKGPPCVKGKHRVKGHCVHKHRKSHKHKKSTGRRAHATGKTER
jgi:hypothetical protein